MSYGINQYESALEDVKKLKASGTNPQAMDVAAFCIAAVIRRTKKYKKVW